MQIRINSPTQPPVPVPTHAFVICLGIVGIILIVLAVLLVMPIWLRVALIAFTVAMIVVVGFIAVGIEQNAGYYECECCHHRYVPTYREVILAPHRGRDRYMRCPKCGKRFWQKKVLTAEDSEL